MSKSSFIIILALTGFLLAFYIYTTKRRGQKLICLIGEDCDKVVRSRWAEVFGIPNEIVGMLYYGLLAASYVALGAFPMLRSGLIQSGLTVASGFAALFSLYLLGIQAFRLKEWCEWCIASTLISIIIFLLVMV